MKRKILITGAAGRIGRFMTRHLAAGHDLLLTDRQPLPEPSGLPFRLADLADLDALAALCSGVDTVLHLAAASRPNATWEQVLPDNLVGARNVFEAAARAGCRRVVFTSSVNVVSGQLPDTAIPVRAPVRPANLYGASKAWGEALACHYAHQTRLSAICLRLGAVVERGERLRPDGRNLDMVITDEDAAQLIVRAIEAPDAIRFAIFNGVSDNRRKQLDIADARAILNYEPEDDAFLLAERGRSRFAVLTGRFLRWAGRRLLG
jgi:nucleoside-diphosphate-sugar epimerase